MRITQAILVSLAVRPAWTANWAWGVSLIVMTVLIHVLGLVLIHQIVVHTSGQTIERRVATVSFVVVMGYTTLLVTFLHGVEAIIWAAAYRILGALPDNNSAMLYSLNAITSYGTLI